MKRGEKKENRICTRDHDKPVEGQPDCLHCAETHASRYFRNKERGMCGVHSFEPALSGTTICQLCVDRRTKSRIKAKESGICTGHPRNKALPGKTICQECVDQEKARRAERIKNGICQVHPEVTALPGKTICQYCTDYNRFKGQEAKRKVFEYYGLKCACKKCPYPEPGIEFLNVDHINNDGSEHRKKIKNYDIYRWLIKENFPPGFQTLCWNCNLAKRVIGVCPHIEPIHTIKEADLHKPKRVKRKSKYDYLLENS